MKKSIKSKKRIPAHAIGLNGFDLSKLFGGNALNSGIQQGANLLPQLTAGIGLNEDTNTMINDVAGTAATGLAVGGPIGAAVGGGVGLVKGLFGIGSNKRRREKARRAKNRQEAVKTRSQLDSQQEELAFDYAIENDIIPTFANGVTNSSSLAYLDDSEIVKTPDGNLSKVNGNPNVKDNVLATIPDGSSVLSDVLINPLTKNTFAQDADKLRKVLKKQPKFYTNTSRNSKELNDKYVDRKTNELIGIQQLVKDATNNNQQEFKDIPKYATGTTMSNRKLKGIGSLGRRIAQQGTDSPGSITNVNPLLNINEENRFLPTINPLDTVSKQVDNIVNPTVNNTASNTNSSNTNNTLNTVGSLLTDILATAPTRYNIQMYNEGPEVESVVTNPNNNQINSLMRSRRIKNRTIREQINNQRAISRYNSRNITNTGANLAYNIAANYSADQNELNALNQIEQVNNNYVADYANVLNNLGQQYSQAVTYTNDINARNRAANNNYKSTALNQLGKFAQVKQLERNQMNRDNGLLSAITPYLKEGFDAKTLNDILASFNN